jgi:hypothetical protein
MPLQLSLVGEMPLQKRKLEICHPNFFILLSMPFSSIPNHIQTLYSRMYPYTPYAHAEKKENSNRIKIPHSNSHAPWRRQRSEPAGAKCARAMPWLEDPITQRSCWRRARLEVVWVGSGRCWKSSPRGWSLAGLDAWAATGRRRGCSCA